MLAKPPSRRPTPVKPGDALVSDHLAQAVQRVIVGSLHGLGPGPAALVHHPRLEQVQRVDRGGPKYRRHRADSQTVEELSRLDTATNTETSS